MTTYNFRFPILGNAKLLSVWRKGKGKKEYRFLFKSLGTLEHTKKGEIFFIWFELNDIPFVGGYNVEFSQEVNPCNYKTLEHIKLGVYNYYLLKDVIVEEIFEQEKAKWLNPNSMFPKTLTSYMHVKYTDIDYDPIVILKK
jgi:hypothetical protein